MAAHVLECLAVVVRNLRGRRAGTALSRLATTTTIDNGVVGGGAGKRRSGLVDATHERSRPHHLRLGSSAAARVRARHPCAVGIGGGATRVSRRERVVQGTRLRAPGAP